MDFYKNLTIQKHFEDLLDPTTYQMLPKNWTVVMTDIVNAINLDSHSAHFWRGKRLSPLHQRKFKLKFKPAKLAMRTRR